MKTGYYNSKLEKLEKSLNTYLHGMEKPLIQKWNRKSTIYN